MVHSQETKKELQKFMQTGNTDSRYSNELDQACFQYDMAYGQSQDLPKTKQSDKVLRDKEFKIASDPKYDGYQRGLASMVYKLFDKNYSGNVITDEPNYQPEVSFINQLLKKLRKEKFIHYLETIFRALI